MSPLSEAIIKGDLATVKALVQLGSNATSCDHSECPILAALNSENPIMMEFVLSSGANPNQYLSNGWTILHEAFDLAIDGMIQNRYDKPTDEILAVIDLLLKSGASLENKSEKGKTPLASLNTYATSPETFERLKSFFRPCIPNIDQLVHYERRLT